MSHHVGQASRCTWRTPELILAPTREFFGGQIGLDPATSPDNPTGARVFYTEVDDGLNQPWTVEQQVFVNPPWSKKPYRPVAWWVAVAWDNALEHKLDIVLTVPAATNSRWWHRYIWGHATVIFPCGRVEYETPPGMLKESEGATFDTAIIYYGDDVERFKDMFRHVGYPAQ